MVVPYTPTTFATPVVNPAVGGSGANPLPYLSVSQYQFAPTAMDTTTLVPGGPGPTQTQALADTIRRASRWADRMCFGADPAAKGASLAASLSVESCYTAVKAGELRLVCDYRPIVEVLGIDVGPDPSQVASIGASASATVRIARRVVTVPYGVGFVSGRPGDTSLLYPTRWAGKLYAVWSYVNGYPHTKLAAAVTAGATSCTVAATNGSGGLWGVFPGTELTVYDGDLTETVTVTEVTAGSTTATVTTTAFANAHSVPSAPDFLPVTALPADVQQAVISLTTMLIKTRGARALVMPQMPGAQPRRQDFAQAGALEDWDIAQRLLTPYMVRVKGKGS